MYWSPFCKFKYKLTLIYVVSTLYTTVKSCWNPWTAMVFTSNLLALICMRTSRNLRQILGFHSHTHEIVYEYGSNPPEILGFQNPKISAGFKNCSWISTLEAEKSPFCNKLSFQRSQSTTGLVQGTVFVKWYYKNLISILIHQKVAQMPIIKCSIIKNIITIKLKPCTRTFS